MATCQAAPFIGTYETNTIGYYITPNSVTSIQRYMQDTCSW